MKPFKTFYMRAKRPGIAMIELIFAIAVIGITLMSVPMLISTSSKSTYVAIQQEAVTMISSHLATLLTMQWDQRDTNSTIGSPVLRTNSPDIPSCSTPFPPGVSDNEGRYCRAMDGNYYNASAILGPDGAGDATGYNDVDDFNNMETNVTVYAGENIQTWQGNYIDINVSLKTRVWYGQDYPRNAAGAQGVYGPTTTFSNPFDTRVTNGTTRNIKLIRVRLTTANTAQELQDKNITMGAFMCNIGAPKEIVWKAY